MTGASWVSADPLFHREPRWLGADAAYSIDLGGDRSLWLFGDTFVATSPALARSASKMVHNTVAVQTGRDPLTAQIAFRWGTGADGAPASFFAEDGALYHWPGHGVRLGDGGPLVVFLSVVKSTPGQGLGFAGAGYRAVLVDHPDDDPATWAPRLLEPAPPPFDAVVGGMVVREAGFVIALATRSAGTHEGYLARVREADLLAGRLAPEWWTGDGGWIAQAALKGKPAVVLDDAGAECSIHFEARTKRWVHVASRGFGATTLAVRVAPALTGPWSAPVDAFLPPESSGTSPFVYAAKAHPELSTSGGGLVVTYATNSFDFGTLFKPRGAALYWPRFAVLTFER